MAGVPVTVLAYPRTIRLVSTARLRASVLEALVDGERELQDLAEIEGATSGRLQAETIGISDLSPQDLVYDVPHGHFINASFAYAKPREPNRFNGERRGAWYAALAVETCLAEVTFHMTDFLQKAGDFHATVDYAEMLCSVSGEFVDLREKPDHPSLAADKASGYRAGNALADDARHAGTNGIIYPSVRHPGGTCLAILRPAAVQSVRQADVWRLVWTGESVPLITGPLTG